MRVRGAAPAREEGRGRPRRRARQQHAAAVAHPRLGQDRQVGELVGAQVEERRVRPARAPQQRPAVREDVPVGVELHLPVGDDLDAPLRPARREDLDVGVVREGAGLVPSGGQQHPPVRQPGGGRVPAAVAHVDLPRPRLREGIEDPELVEPPVAVAPGPVERAAHEEDAAVRELHLAGAEQVRRWVNPVAGAGDRVVDVADPVLAGVLLGEEDVPGGQQDRVDGDGRDGPRRAPAADVGGGADGQRARGAAPRRHRDHRPQAGPHAGRLHAPDLAAHLGVLGRVVPSERPVLELAQTGLGLERGRRRRPGGEPLERRRWRRRPGGRRQAGRQRGRCHHHDRTCHAPHGIRPRADFWTGRPYDGSADGEN